MTHVFKPADLAEQSAFVRSHCSACPRQLGCTILADARPLDPTDPDYPAELVHDDEGLPNCTAFEAATMLDAPAAPAPAAATVAAAPARARAAKATAPRPGQPLVFVGPLRGITITTRRARDGSAETTTLRLQLAGGDR